MRRENEMTVKYTIWYQWRNISRFSIVRYFPLIYCKTITPWLAAIFNAAIGNITVHITPDSAPAISIAEPLLFVWALHRLWGMRAKQCHHFCGVSLLDSICRRIKISSLYAASMSTDAYGGEPPRLSDTKLRQATTASSTHSTYSPAGLKIPGPAIYHSARQRCLKIHLHSHCCYGYKKVKCQLLLEYSLWLFCFLAYAYCLRSHSPKMFPILKAW